MDLTTLVTQLSAHAEAKVRFFGASGVEERRFADVAVDVRVAVERLRGLGVAPGMHIGILAGNRYEWLVYDLALLELRCHLVALPEEQRDEGPVALIKRHGLALLLLASAETAAGALPPGVAFLDADGPPGGVAREGEHGPDPAYLEMSTVFSSGSTGELKGMIASRKGAEAWIDSIPGAFEFLPDDAFLVFLPMSNYQQRLFCFAALWYGVDLLIADPARLFVGLRAMQPTLLLAPPIFFETIAARFEKLPRWQRTLVGALGALATTLPGRWRAALLRRVYASLYQALGGRMRFMITGMAPIPRGVLDFFARSGIALYEAYGMNECGIIAWNSPRAQRLGTVGRPVEPGSVTLADDGEILVRKRHPTTLRYIGTAAEQGDTYLEGGCIATGDIGRFDADGFLCLTGRKKDLLLTAEGRKIHPARLEAPLRECPGVGHAVVTCAPGQRHLTAVVSCDATDRERVERGVARAVRRYNDAAPADARIENTVLTTESFSRENGLLTGNLKPNRGAIAARFAKEIAPARSAS